MTLQRPQFFVIGGSRCGTTTIHAALERHPGIFVPSDKSPNYFVAPDMKNFPDSAAMAAMKGHTVKTEKEYFSLFKNAPSGALCGEVSPVYSQSIYTAARISQFASDARIVAILRNPVDRAFAHFIGRKRDGLEERPSFEEAIAAELADPSPKDIAFNNYLSIGKYGHFIKTWFEAFPRNQIKVIFFDDFIAQPLTVLNDLFIFLDATTVGEDFLIDRKNQSGIIKQPILRGIWTGTTLLRAKVRLHLPRFVRDAVGNLFFSSMDKPLLEDAIRHKLGSYFSEDTLLLQKQLGMSVPWQYLLEPTINTL